jgi:hypothetical protein
MTATFLTPVIAAALLVGLELIAGPRRDLAWLVVVGLGAALVALGVMLAATLAAGRSLGLTVAGMAAAVAAIGLLRTLLER